jgi:hypothetical protein
LWLVAWLLSAIPQSIHEQVSSGAATDWNNEQIPELLDTPAVTSPSTTVSLEVRGYQARSLTRSFYRGQAVSRYLVILGYRAKSPATVDEDRAV